MITAIDPSTQLVDLLQRIKTEITNIGSNKEIIGTLPEIADLLTNKNNQAYFFNIYIPELLSNTEQLISDTLTANRNKLTSTRGASAAWRKLTDNRKDFSDVLNFAAAQADKHSFLIPQDIIVRSQLILLAGPRRQQVILPQALRALDEQLEFSPAFQKKEAEILSEICDQLSRLGITTILKNTPVEGPSTPSRISVQDIADLVTRVYQLTSIPVKSNNKIKNGMPHFDQKKRIVNLYSQSFNNLNDKQRLWLLMHELRHGIIWSLTDNARFARNDGSPTVYKHGTAHQLVRNYPLDIAKSEIGEISRNFKSTLILSQEAHGILYSRLFSERDADLFASRIIANLCSENTNKIMQEYLALTKVTAATTKGTNSRPSNSKIVQLEAPNSSLTNPLQPLNLRQEIVTAFHTSQAETDPKEDMINFVGNSSITTNLAKRDPFQRLQGSLALQAISAKFRNSLEAQESLSRLNELANKTFPGIIGLEKFKVRLTEVLANPRRLSKKVLMHIHESLDKLSQKLEYEKNLAGGIQTSTINKSNVVAVCKQILNPNNSRIQTTSSGHQITLFEATIELEQELAKKNYIKAARLLVSILELAEQGWLGEWNTNKFKEHWPNITTLALVIKGKNLRKLFLQHTEKAATLIN